MPPRPFCTIVEKKVRGAAEKKQEGPLRVVVGFKRKDTKKLKGTERKGFCLAHSGRDDG
jgi:hypothetical protein